MTRYRIWLTSRTSGLPLLVVHSTRTRRGATRWVRARAHLQPYTVERITR